MGGDGRLQALPFHHDGQLHLFGWQWVPLLPAQGQPWYPKPEHPAACTAQ